MAFDTSRISPELLLAAGSALAGGQNVGQQLGNLGAYTAPVFAAQRENFWMFFWLQSAWLAIKFTSPIS